MRNRMRNICKKPNLHFHGLYRVLLKIIEMKFIISILELVVTFYSSKKLEYDLLTYEYVNRLCQFLTIFMLAYFVFGKFSSEIKCKKYYIVFLWLQIYFTVFSFSF